MEFLHQGFGQDELANVVVGGNTSLYVQNDFSSKTLDAVGSPWNIPQQTEPPDPTTDGQGQFQLTGSLFVGYEQDWYALHTGLSVLLRGFDEKSRETKVDGSTTPASSSGRGWVWGDNSLILPNLYVRLGLTTMPYLVFEILRGEFDPGYGSVQAYVHIPISKEFKLDVGGTLYQVDDIFLQPTYQFGNISVNLRLGTILNYNDSHFTRVGVLEGFFLASGVSFLW